MRTASLIVFLLLSSSLLACGSGSPEAASSESVVPPPASSAPVADSSSVDSSIEDERPVIVFLGDSLTAGFGLDEEQAFPTLVEQALRADGIDVRTVNAGVSGDTTAGGLRRVDWLLRQDPDLVVVALGGNDGLRGLPPEEMESNLRGIVERVRASGADVVLAGMLAPPNLGAEYTEAFAAVYPRLAQEQEAALIPFLLEGVAAVPELNLSDGIHPNVEGQQKVAQNVLPHLKVALESDLGPSAAQ